MIPFAMWTPSVWELAIILVIVMVLFGAGKLPTVFSQLGSALKTFRDAQKDDGTSDGDDAKRISETPDIEEAQEVKEKAELKSGN